MMLMIQKDPWTITARDAACGYKRLRGLCLCTRRSVSPMQESPRGAGSRGDVPGGFSMLELIIAVALVATVAAFSIPAFNRYSANADLKTAARAVAADLSSAKQTAVTENIDACRLTFNVGGNSYALSRTDTGVTLWTKSVASFGGGIALSAANFGGGAEVSFQRRGTMTSGSVDLRNGLGSTAVVTVNFTGRTYVTFNMQ
jgi:prepilin-type N-terminal cleavage/methylation domain-containing protein